MINMFYYYSPVGILSIFEKEGYIIRIDFGKTVIENSYINKSVVINKTISQLKEYFSGKRKEFHIPLKIEGTVFQKNVWEALRKIPYGETRSYKEIAIMAGNEKACRAVGMANNKNPIPIIIPCHRVIGADGKLVGYGGGIDIKIKLLKLEQNN